MSIYGALVVGQLMAFTAFVKAVPADTPWYWYALLCVGLLVTALGGYANGFDEGFEKGMGGLRKTRGKDNG